MKKTVPRSRSGAGVIEYMLILGTIGTVCVAATVLLGGRTSSLLERSLTSSQPALQGAVVLPADSDPAPSTDGSNGTGNGNNGHNGNGNNGNGNGNNGNGNNGKALGLAK